jgi:hypothetical protein
MFNIQNIFFVDFTKLSGSKSKGILEENRGGRMLPES